MAIISEKSLEFAREHISKYYDSDFFPKPIEYEALWYQWHDFKAELMSKNVAKLWVTQPRAMTIAKPKGGFRIVHQLEPIDSVIYTALACEITDAIEAARTTQHRTYSVLLPPRNFRRKFFWRWLRMDRLYNQNREFGQPTCKRSNYRYN